MKISRTPKLIAIAVAGASLIGGGTAAAGTASPSVAGASGQTSPAPVQVTNFPATQNVAGTVSVGNFPATQNVGGTVNVGNLPATQSVSGTVSVGGGTVGLDPTQNTVQAAQSGTWNVGISGTPTVKLDPSSTVKLDPSASVAVTDKTVAVLQHQYTNAGSLPLVVYDVSSYKSLFVEAVPPAGSPIPPNCAIDLYVNDLLAPDNNVNGQTINEAVLHLTSSSPAQHVALSAFTPFVSFYTYDVPTGCASNALLDVGLYGRPN